MIAGVAVAIASLVLRAPVVAVASDGPWVAVAEGRSPHDCDRVSIWNAYRPNMNPHRATLFRLGRRTSCARPNGRIAAVSEIDNRAVWLHVGGGAPSEWTVWTASTRSRSPRLLARVTQDPGKPPPILLGPGNKDRGQLSFGEGDVLPYAIGDHVIVLGGDGRSVFTWTAPSPVTALDSNPGLFVVGVADGQIFLFVHDLKWHLEQTFPGSDAARHVFWIVNAVVAQHGTRLDELPVGQSYCSRTRALRPGEQLVAAGGGLIVLAVGRHYRVLPGCRGPAVATGNASAVALDNLRLTIGSGRRVTTRVLPW